MASHRVLVLVTVMCDGVQVDRALVVALVQGRGCQVPGVLVGTELRDVIWLQIVCERHVREAALVDLIRGGNRSLGHWEGAGLLLRSSDVELADLVAWRMHAADEVLPAFQRSIALAHLHLSSIRIQQVGGATRHSTHAAEYD